MKVFVYWNLHLCMWSVKALEGPNKGRVILRTDQIALEHVTGKVSEAGRQRVLREGRKNVHAGLVGNMRFEGVPSGWLKDCITYNPYKYTSFVYENTGERFEGARYAYLTSNRNVFVSA
jgi:hypothetical protein